jgi:hypothetical protein
VIACASKRKQEKEADDSRVSVTSLRCGNAAGAQGPTFILMKGKLKRDGFHDQFLEKNGAAPGSTILMTPNAFMTDDSFDAMAAKLATGTRAYVPDYCCNYKIARTHSHTNCRVY